MYILLVNTNPIVSRLFALSAKSMINIYVDEINGQESTPRGHYDMLFIDEESALTEDIQLYLNRVNAVKKVLFATDRGHSFEGIDAVIIKPFLPSEVITMLQSLSGDSQATIERDIDAFVSNRREKEKSHSTDRDKSAGIESIILDNSEIETIKQLLLDDEFEVSEDEEYSLHCGSSTVEEEISLDKSLLKALTKMKPKKIKKSLAGAEVSITIRFPREV
ncbi:MAG: hypothetical protein U9R27_00690 [Campylobacterota bacterium]|nr:hypothetical protein [Campylobacterota bacterium]